MPRFLPARFPTFLWLGLAVALSILAVNAHGIFGTELYEHGDGAANSFQILRAKHFQNLYGQYSRWGFHHPGPGWFYAQAAGEGLFYDALHIVPTPFNGQLLITVLLLTGFFAAAVATAARWVSNRWFVPLTLILAVLHFTAVNGSTVFASTWPAFVMVTPFLCLLVAAASVGAGRGEDLPLLVLAGGALLHAHIAQPLFVFPLWALAYAGLLWTCGRGHGREGQDVAGRGGDAGNESGRRALPWRAYPRAHLGAGALAALFALPVAIDLCRGADSNFALILAHRRTHAGEHHTWLESISYLLRFGVYRPYREGEGFYHGGTTGAELHRFVVNHPRMLGLWLGALLAFLAGWLWVYRRQGNSPRSQPIPTAGPPLPAVSAARFLGWLGACWLAAVGLTLCWGVIQDGQMFYFNAWFNYAIYFALAMGAAASGSKVLEALTGRLPSWLRTGAAGVLLVVAAGLFAQRAGRFRLDYGGDEVSRAMARSVDEALAAQPGEPHLRFLSFSDPAWEAAAGVALRLERLGYEFRVQPGWWLMFGRDRSPDHPPEDLTRPGGSLFRLWRIKLPAVGADGSSMRGHPLVLGCVLDTVGDDIDPVPGAEVAFTGGSRTFAAYTLYGWAPPDPDAPFTFSVGPEGMLSFHPRPVPADPGTAVEMTFDLFPVLSPGKRERQRLSLRYNDVDLGTWEIGREAEKSGQPLRVRVPAAVWNARPEALLAFGFPDAISPLEMDNSPDTRPFAFGFRTIRFQAVKNPVPGP